MRINSNSSVLSDKMPSRYSGTLHYVIENMVMMLIAVSVVGITWCSHSIGLPLYKLNPMHWVIYLAILFRKPSAISIVVLAFAMPFTSLLLTGHPMVYKSVIMGVELSIYGIIFSLILNHVYQSITFAYIVSQIFGLVIYFSLKYLLIKMELMNSAMFSSSIIIQIIVFIILGLCLQIISIQRQKV
ncbi:hypothetical protein ACFL4B_00565 [Candidatus Neomarinimicrobiota bacterium]